MSASTLQQALSYFRMTDDSGLVTTNGASQAASNDHPRAKRILHDAGALGASHVLFRFPENPEKPPIPQAFIFDFSADPVPPEYTAELQRKIWNTGIVPLIFVFQDDRVDIFNALKEPTLDEDGLPQKLSAVEILNLAANISKRIESRNKKVAERFSGDLFANGTFWDDAENSKLLAQNTAQKTLLQEMRNAHRAIAAHTKLSTELTRRFFILCLMVKYLEDRKILRADYFKDFHAEAETFEHLLRCTDNQCAALIRCLKALSIRFNGDVFSLTEEDEEAISTEDLTPYADFVAGNLEGAQRHLWKLYSFQYLPVELISYIYEDFLKHNKVAVYTPHMLVDLLLDELMPAQKIPTDKRILADYRILDPACGSGVFLVGAFRRLVEAQSRQLSDEELCAILETNIRGVDTDPIAVELTSFSLCVAMCSELTPESARAKMKFPTLAGKIVNNTSNDARSIRECNFFSLTKHADEKPGAFDLIIGNPPFGSNKDGKDHDPLAAEVALKTKGPRVDYPGLPDKQLCYLFLREAPKLLKEGGVGCLLQKDGFLYNGGVQEFRAAFLQNYDVPQILDFVSIRHMFPGHKSNDDGKTKKDKVGVKTVAVFFRRPAENEPLSAKPILHATFRKLFTVRENRGFELDAYDYHWVSRRIAIEEPRVWKANLLGGGRLLATYRAYANEHVRSVGGYIKARGRKPEVVMGETHKAKDDAARIEDEKTKWICSEGFIAGDKSAKALSDKIKMPEKFLETDGLTLDGVDESFIKPLSVTHYASTRDVRLYEPPHLLIRENETLPLALRREKEGSLAFKDQIVGIKCPIEDEDKLALLAEFIETHREWLQFFLSFSSKYLVNMYSAIMKKDIMDLPFPEGGHIEFRGVEQSLVRDVIDRQSRFISSGAAGEPSLFKPTTATQLTEYTETFLQVLQTVYPETKLAEQCELSNAHCIAFSFGEKPGVPLGDAAKLEAHLDELLHKQKSPALRICRIVRMFGENRLFFVKPKAYRFWTRSIAVRDADEVFASLVAQGF